MSRLPLTLWLQQGTSMKKLIVRSETARIVRQKNGDWYLLWYDDKGKRYRGKFGINCEKDLGKREKLATHYLDIIKKTLERGETVTDATIAESKPKNHDFFSYVERFIARKESEGLSHYTVRKFRSLRNSLKSYEAETLKVLSFAGFDKEWAIAYKNWRYAPPRKHHRNHVAKDFRLLLQILREAEIEDGIPVNPKYRSDAYKVSEIVSDAVALTFDEVQRIANADLSDLSAGYTIARDSFVVGCLTGLRYGDWKIEKSQKSRLRTGEGSIVVLKKLTRKTGEAVTIALHPIAKAILERYDYELPCISNQRTNDFIKIIAARAGLVEMVSLKTSEGGKTVMRKARKCDAVSTHTARRSFVTIGLYEWRVPPQYLMRITGHKSERQLYHYARAGKDDAAIHLHNFFQETVS